MQKIAKQISKPAFSFIELLVVMAMIGIGLLGITSLATQNIRVQYFNRNQLIAAQLAQEGLELARNLRDNQWKATPSPINLAEIYLPGFTIDYQRISIEYSESDINEDLVNQTPALLINEEGFYNYSYGDETPFRRVLTSECREDEATETEYCLMKCYVSWQAQGQADVYQVEDYFYNWYDHNED